MSESPQQPKRPVRPPEPDGMDKVSRWERRKLHIREEIHRNRTEGPVIPSWVYLLVLLAIVGGVAALVAVA